MRRPPVIPSPDSIGPDTPLRLDVAATLAFPGGGMTASGLRKERDRGRLAVERIAGKEFTTLAAIDNMRSLCRDPLSLRASTPAAKTAGGRNGSSSTEAAKSAQARALMTAQRLKALSRTTSPKSASRISAQVIPIASSSPTR